MPTGKRVCKAHARAREKDVHVWRGRARGAGQKSGAALAPPLQPASEAARRSSCAAAAASPGTHLDAQHAGGRRKGAAHGRGRAVHLPHRPPHAVRHERQRKGAEQAGVGDFHARLALQWRRNTRRAGKRGQRGGARAWARAKAGLRDGQRARRRLACEITVVRCMLPATTRASHGTPMAAKSGVATSDLASRDHVPLKLTMAGGPSSCSAASAAASAAAPRSGAGDAGGAAG